MKYLLFILSLSGILSISSIAQTNVNNIVPTKNNDFTYADTTKKQQANKTADKSVKADSCKGKCRNNDCFIDNDNDGMNDNRCKGMGSGCKNKYRKCKGKKK
jgi:hypothetical protein